MRSSFLKYFGEDKSPQVRKKHFTLKEEHPPVHRTICDAIDHGPKNRTSPSFINAKDARRSLAHLKVSIHKSCTTSEGRKYLGNF